MDPQQDHRKVWRPCELVREAAKALKDLDCLLVMKDGAGRTVGTSPLSGEGMARSREGL